MEVVKTLASNTKVVIAAMRALGNLGSLEKNVMWMLENGAVSNLVFAMEHPANRDKHELVQTGAFFCVYSKKKMICFCVLSLSRP